MAKIANLRDIWKDVFICWSEDNFNEKLETKEEVFQQYLWFNSHLKIKGEIICFLEFIEVGINYVGDICDGNKCYSWEDLKRTCALDVALCATLG